MQAQPLEFLLNWLLKEYEQQHSIFGIHRSLFYTPRPDAPYTSTLFGQRLGTPIGPAAGPHTQLAQNIVCAWLCGGRFIELKTVQIRDDLTIPRPCIDMADEGYNVEWSQELKLHESAQEYIHAWVLIHLLPRLLGWEGRVANDTIFNMSVGYNLEGIQQPAMTRFMDTLADATEEIAACRALLRRKFPQFADIEIPSQITDNVTLSTMHGCPPDEIERIAHYLLVERGLHTTVKLNPTLLGQERVLDILHHHLGYSEIHIPDAVFAHDLQYNQAVALIRSLQSVAAGRGLTFGVKLSNTLAMANHRQALPGDEVYMSGRALYPITINLFHRLAREFNGNLVVSYSAGADALNVADILAAGARPVTVASDLLKPGGYARLGQYLENLEAAMQARSAHHLDELAGDPLVTLQKIAAAALTEPRYQRHYRPPELPKVSTGLGLFDCIDAPCMEPCAVHQHVPEYAWWIAQGDYDRALTTILARNPLPGITGYVCTQLCQTRCTRLASNYEAPVAIRALKRIAAERGRITLTPRPATGHRVAIIGAGPAGLSAACFLALHGVQVTIFEAKDTVGGMMRYVPSFRLPSPIIQEDVERILALGVELKLNSPVTEPPEQLLQQGFAAVYVATGFQKNTPLAIEGAHGQGVFSAFDLLARVRRGEPVNLGRKALVIGGGDTAMDATRVARRLTGQPATIVYRRTRHEMPASPDELQEALAEGNHLEELATPVRVILKDGRVAALVCVRNRLGEPGTDGRRQPQPIPGSEFQIEADAIIVAIGQQPELIFLAGSGVTRHKNGSIAVDADSGRAGVPGVYAGGDVVDGPESIIAACADGRRAAEGICRELGIAFQEPVFPTPALSEAEIAQVKRVRARKEAQHRPEMLPVAQRAGFDLIEQTLSEGAARAEAWRCLQCATFCDKCVEVCPNRANLTYFVAPVSLNVPRLACQGGKLVVTGHEPFRVTQTRQIVHIDDLCNECGNCETFCVHQGKPYREKPRLFWQRRFFVQENDNAFYIAPNGSGWRIDRREGGEESHLDWQASQVTFENDCVQVTLRPADFQIEALTLRREFSGEISLVGAAEMWVLLKGVTTSLPLNGASQNFGLRKS